MKNRSWSGERSRKIPPPVPPPPEPVTVTALHEPPSQDEAFKPPTRLTRSVPIEHRNPLASSVVGRTLWRPKAMGANDKRAIIRAEQPDGQVEIVNDDGSSNWVKLQKELDEGTLAFAYVQCGCANVIDGLCVRDLALRVRRPTEHKLEVIRYLGLHSVLVRGKRQNLISKSHYKALLTFARGIDCVQLARYRGRHGGPEGKLKKTLEFRRSPQCTRFGICKGSGVATNGTPISLLAGYSSQYSDPNWPSAQHIVPCLDELGRKAHSLLYELLSPATQEAGAFTKFDVRCYNGDSVTGEHTDTRPADSQLDDEGEPKKADFWDSISQEKDTDVVIFTLGDTMYFRRKLYSPGKWKEEDPYLESIPLARGTFFIWRTCRGPSNEQRDDWREKHAINWPQLGEEAFVPKDCEDLERVAIVMRVTNKKSDGWYATAHPHRVVA